MLKIDPAGLLARSADVEQIIDSSELGSPWEYLEVPPTDPRLPQEIGPWTLNSDISSCHSIRDWIEFHHDGDMLAALRQSPLIVSTDPETGLMDGWHRLSIAHERGQKVIPIILIEVRWMKGNGLSYRPKLHHDWAGGG